MGGQLKTCDAHGKPFPENIVDSNKTELVRVYVERYFPDQKDAKKKIKATMFVGDEQVEEGADFCIADFNRLISSAIVPIAGKVTWKIVTWEKETIEKKDGSGTYERNVKHIKDLE